MIGHTVCRDLPGMRMDVCVDMRQIYSLVGAEALKGTVSHRNLAYIDLDTDICMRVYVYLLGRYLGTGENEEAHRRTILMVVIALAEMAYRQLLFEWYS